MRVYLDTCCLNRPFDLSNEPRILLEATAMLMILDRLLRGEWTWVASEILTLEVQASKKVTIRETLLELLTHAPLSVPLSEREKRRAVDLGRHGIKTLDGQHIACAEAAGSDVFLTTDDRLLKAAARNPEILRVRVINPTDWLREVLE